MIKKNILLYFLLVCAYIPGIFSQNFKISKVNSNYPVSNQSIVYALPRTGITINIEMIKTYVTKGPYAEYAQKYLGISNATMENSEKWTINEITISPYYEPDPEQYYCVNFKTFPENIQTILSKENNGVLLDLSGKWRYSFRDVSDVNDKIIFDPHFIKETNKEHVDTLYKTILNDTSFVRVPVFKKQILAKTYEDLVKETAHEIIKTRKNRIKYARGEYDYHPDGATLRVMLDEMQKLEDEYLSLFIGKQSKLVVSKTINLIPDKNISESILGYFGENTGWTSMQLKGAESISIQFLKSETPNLPLLQTDKTLSQNILFYRIPAYFDLLLEINQTEKAKYRVPLYQFGTVEAISLIEK